MTQEQGKLFRWYDRFAFNTQIFAIFLCAILVVGLITSVLLTRVSSKKIYEHQIEQGLKVTNFMARQAEVALLFQSADVASDIANSVIDLPDVKAISIRTQNLDELFSIGGQFPEGSFGVPPEETALIHESKNLWVFSAPVFSNQGEQNQLISSSGEEQRFLLGYISILVSKDAKNELINSITRNNLWAAGLLVLFLGLLMWATSRAMGPIRELSKIMTSAQGGEEELLCNVYGPRDIAQMQSAFNKLMKDLYSQRNKLQRAAQSAEELARTKGEFVANVTHELRTPLGGVLGMLDLMMTTSMSSKQREYLEIINSSAQSLLDLVDEVLTFSEVESGKLKIEAQTCHLTDILDEVISLLAAIALKKSIGIGYVINPDVPKVVSTDGTKLRQMLINLLGNAVKFTNRGEVAIYVDQKHTSAADITEICFRVRDDGIGIDPEHHQQIFEAFLQLDSSSTKTYRGTGLGLAIVKKVAQLMGGNINVASKLGSGSEFCLTLPIHGNNQQPSQCQSDLLLNKRFLVVTESPILGNFLLNELLSLGAERADVKSGSAVIRAIKGSNRNKQWSEYHGLIVDEELGEIPIADFYESIERELDLQAIFSVILINPYFSSYHLDSLPAARLPKPLKSYSLEATLIDNFLPNAKSLTPSEVPVLAVKNAIKVLVIEDNRTNQQVAEAMLNRLGCSCEVVENGQIGVEKVVFGDFDLVLMDCNMPVLNGYAATKQIRAFEEEDAGRLPIIAMTANYSDLEKERCAEAGMSDFMPKPLSLLTMRQKLSQWSAYSASEISSIEKTEFSDKAMQSNQKIVADKMSYSPQALNRLQLTLGASVNSLIKDFFQDMSSYLEALRQAVSGDNAREIHFICHTIRGAADNFGANQLIKLSSQLENKAMQGNLKGSSEIAMALIESYAALRADLSQALALDDLPDGMDEIDSKGTVLVVDDDITTREILEAELKIDNLVVKQVAGGFEAIHFCQKKMPDLILMDAMMPDLDGFETCKKIRQMVHGWDIPILIMTASESDDSIKHAFSANATDYIRKPVNIAVMQKRIVHLISTTKAERQIKRMAYHDSLTGLPNRAYLMQHLQLLIEQCAVDSSAFAILFLDLDHFKAVNDTMGHDSGDLLLKAVAERLQSHVQGQDFIARLSGDEFTIVLENIRSPSSVSAIATKICHSLKRPFLFMRHEMFVTASIGISMFPNDGEDITDLMKHADSAMFNAKTSRDGFRFYKPGMEMAMSRRLEMERELNKAIELGQLQLLYQPKIDLNCAKLVGSEALLRWQHPVRGLMGPDEFIPLAEESDLIADLNNWVLNAGIKQLCEWLNLGYQTTLALNLSLKGPIVRQLKDTIPKLVKRNSIPPKVLELEITESTLINQPEQIVSELSRIRELGVMIALDDFGSGYSSLNQLKQLPVDILKFDRLFIQDIESDPKGASIVKSIVDLAKALDMQTVAEGVETEEQRNILKQLGCDTYQGYLTSTPLPASDFERLFLKKHQRSEN